METASTISGTAAADLPVLVADLDGTVLRSDMLVESFWATASQSPRAAAGALGRLRDGRAAFKAALADRAKIDPALLPYNEDVLERLRAHRAQGGRTALVTASDQRLAESVAGHLDLFDEVIGSNGAMNLKGAQKADVLVQSYGAGGFDYIGDAKADLAVWQQAHAAITVGASATLRQDAEQCCEQVTHLGARPDWRPYLRALRPHQWSKNLLVFLPVIAAHQADPRLWGLAFAAFVAFCLTASSVYLLNDLLDLASDRKHPTKRARPLAAGDIPIVQGALMAPALFLAGMVVALIFTPWSYVGLLAGYFAITLAYSFALKRMLIVDICTLAGLYTIRLIGGGLATGIELSPWLLAFSVFLFLSLAAVKRQAELVGGVARGELKASGRAYRADDLPIVAMMAISAGYVSVLVLALYLNSNVVQDLYDEPLILLGICPVLIYWISRVVMLTHRGHMNEDPVVFALKDRISRLTVLVMGIIVLVAVKF